MALPWAQVLYTHRKRSDDELAVVAGDYVRVVDQNDSGWWVCEQKGGQLGAVPAAYCRLDPDVTESPWKAAPATVSSRQSRALLDWTRVDVADWAQARFPRLKARFEEHGVTGVQLGAADDHLLSSWGVTNIHDRTDVMRAVDRLKRRLPASASASMSSLAFSSVSTGQQQQHRQKSDASSAPTLSVEHADSSKRGSDASPVGSVGKSAGRRSRSNSKSRRVDQVVTEDRSRSRSRRGSDASGGGDGESGSDDSTSARRKRGHRRARSGDASAHQRLRRGSSASSAQALRRDPADGGGDGDIRRNQSAVLPGIDGAFGGGGGGDGRRGRSGSVSATRKNSVSAGSDDLRSSTGSNSSNGSIGRASRISKDKGKGKDKDKGKKDKGSKKSKDKDKDKTNGGDEQKPGAGHLASAAAASGSYASPNSRSANHLRGKSTGSGKAPPLPAAAPPTVTDAHVLAVCFKSDTGTVLSMSSGGELLAGGDARRRQSSGTGDTGAGGSGSGSLGGRRRVRSLGRSSNIRKPAVNGERTTPQRQQRQQAEMRAAGVVRVKRSGSNAGVRLSVNEMISTFETLMEASARPMLTEDDWERLTKPAPNSPHVERRRVPTSAAEEKTIGGGASGGGASSGLGAVFGFGGGKKKSNTAAPSVSPRGAGSGDAGSDGEDGDGLSESRKFMTSQDVEKIVEGKLERRRSRAKSSASSPLMRPPGRSQSGAAGNANVVNGGDGLSPRRGRSRASGGPQRTPINRTLMDAFNQDPMVRGRESAPGSPVTARRAGATAQQREVWDSLPKEEKQTRLLDLLAQRPQMDQLLAQNIVPGGEAIDKRKSQQQLALSLLNRPSPGELQDKGLLSTEWIQPTLADGETAMVVPSGGINVELGRQTVVGTLAEFRFEETEKYAWHYTNHFASLDPAMQQTFGGEIKGRTWFVVTCEVPQKSKSKSKSDEKEVRALVRTKYGDQLVQMGYSGKSVDSKDVRRVLKETHPDLPVKDISSSKVVSMGCAAEQLQDELSVFEKQNLSNTFKVGLLLVRGDQTDDTEMFSNEHATPAMEEFMAEIGETIRLKDWSKYRDGLDTKNDSTGTHSLYTEYKGFEFMFHVSTMLPFQPDDEQKVERKRHLGNDVVVIIFLDDGAESFDPQCMRSEFNHAFIVVKPETDDDGKRIFRICAAAKAGVRPFGPVLPDPPLFAKGPRLRDLVLTKCINAQRASLNVPNFSSPIRRTRNQMLKAICESCAK